MFTFSRSVLELRESLGATVVVVTHDEQLAQAGDRTLVIRDGKVR